MGKYEDNKNTHMVKDAVEYLRYQKKVISLVNIHDAIEEVTGKSIPLLLLQRWTDYMIGHDQLKAET